MKPRVIFYPMSPLPNALLTLIQKVRLQILPPTLPYARTMRIGVSVDIRFVPRSTGFEVNHPRGRIFILSDLFLLCEQIAPGEKSIDNPRADTWLLYPPLAGKHLKVEKAVDQGWAPHTLYISFY
jgi:hypothetical protein